MPTPSGIAVNKLMRSNLAAERDFRAFAVSQLVHSESRFVFETFYLLSPVIFMGARLRDCAHVSCGISPTASISGEY